MAEKYFLKLNYQDISVFLEWLEKFKSVAIMFENHSDLFS
jgi:hypothetical protein